MADDAQLLMHRSGLWLQLDGVAPQIRAGLVDCVSGRGRRIQPSEMERLRQTIEAAYAVDRLRASALRTVATLANPADMPALFAGYGSQTGRAIVKLEEAGAADNQEPGPVSRSGQELTFVSVSRTVGPNQKMPFRCA